MNFFKNRFRAAALLFLVTFACLVSVHAVDIRRAGRDTQFTYNGVTYTFRRKSIPRPTASTAAHLQKAAAPYRRGIWASWHISTISVARLSKRQILYITQTITAPPFPQLMRSLPQALTIAARQSSYMILLSGTISADMQTAMQNFLRFPLRQHQPFRRKALIR